MQTFFIFHVTGEPKEIEDKFRCPDCDKPFMYVAPLYIHAATTHYNEQLKAKYLPIYREHGKCHLCGSVVTQTSLVSHFGGKHRRILTFMEEEKRQLYMSMKKRSWTNFRDTGGLSCKYEACGKSFRNLTMYKQHLANTHVRTELLNQTRQTIKGIFKYLKCTNNDLPELIELDKDLLFLSYFNRCTMLFLRKGNDKTIQSSTAYRYLPQPDPKLRATGGPQATHSARCQRPRP